MTVHLYVVGAYRPLASAPDAVKIGIAKNVNKRLESMQTNNHLELRLLRTYTLASRESALHAEQMAMRYMRAINLRGEWFAPDLDKINGATQGAVAKARGLGGVIYDIKSEQDDHDRQCLVALQQIV